MGLQPVLEPHAKLQFLTVNLLTVNSQLLTLSKVFPKCLVVVLAVAQFAVDEADEFYGCLEAELLIAGTEDVLMEDVSHALLLQPQARKEFVIASQRNLVLAGSFSPPRIHALIVHFGKAEAAFLQEEMAGMLHVVQIVGVVHDASISHS